MEPWPTSLRDVKSPDWDRFFDPENIELDEPNIPVIEACKAMKAHAPVEGLFYAPSQERGFPR